MKTIVNMHLLLPFVLHDACFILQAIFGPHGEINKIQINEVFQLTPHSQQSKPFRHHFKFRNKMLDECICDAQVHAQTQHCCRASPVGFEGWVGLLHGTIYYRRGYIEEGRKKSSSLKVTCFSLTSTWGP